MTLSITEWTLQLFYMIAQACRTGRSPDPRSSTGVCFPHSWSSRPGSRLLQDGLYSMHLHSKLCFQNPSAWNLHFLWRDLNQLLVKREDFMKQMQPDPSEHTRQDISTFACENLEELWLESNPKTEQRFMLDWAWHPSVQLYWMTDNDKHKHGNIYRQKKLV